MEWERRRGGGGKCFSIIIVSRVGEIYTSTPLKSKFIFHIPDGRLTFLLGFQQSHQWTVKSEGHCIVVLHGNNAWHEHTKASAFNI